MIEYFGIPVCQSDGTLNPAVAGLCEVTSIEQRYREPVRFEIMMREPTSMDEVTCGLFDDYFKLKKHGQKKTHRERDLVERVVHNPPATIVFWKDKTKTVVKQQDGDAYDPEKGFMAASTKKFFGNDNQFNYEIKWYVPKQEQAEPNLVNNKAEIISDEVAKQIVEETPEADTILKEFANVMFGGACSGETC